MNSIKSKRICSQLIPRDSTCSIPRLLLHGEKNAREKSLLHHSPGSLCEKARHWGCRDSGCCYLNCSFCQCHDIHAQCADDRDTDLITIHRGNMSALFGNSQTCTQESSHIPIKPSNPTLFVSPFDSVQSLSQYLALVG